MKFGVFDHIDEAGVPVGQQFEERLALIERYEHAGFHAYHLAEHHGTPLGHAPSPSVFLAAATQRTTTLRLGPLVYCLPLYHPLRLIDEVCMLDHLSDGRLQLGVGAGVSPSRSASSTSTGKPPRALRRELRDPAEGPGLRRADPPRRALRLRRRPHDAVPRPAAASAAVVRHLARRPRRVGGRARGQRRRPAAAGDGPADHRRLPGRVGGARTRPAGHPVHGRLAAHRRRRDRRRGHERRAARVPPVVREPQPAVAQVRRPLPSRRRAARGLRRLAQRRRRLRRHAGQGDASTSRPRSRRRGSTTSAPTSRSATSPSRRRRARSSSSRARSSPRSTRSPRR